MCTLITGPVSHSCQGHILVPSETGGRGTLWNSPFSQHADVILPGDRGMKRENSVGETRRERVLDPVEEDGAALPLTHKLSLQRRTEGLGNRLMAQHTTLARLTRQFELNGGDYAHIAERNAAGGKVANLSSRRRPGRKGEEEEEVWDMSGISSSITLQTVDWFTDRVGSEILQCTQSLNRQV